MGEGIMPQGLKKKDKKNLKKKKKKKLNAKK